MVDDEDDSSAGSKGGAGDRSCNDDEGSLLGGCAAERAVGVEAELVFEHCVLFVGGVCDIENSNRLGVSCLESFERQRTSSFVRRSRFRRFVELTSETSWCGHSLGLVGCIMITAHHRE
jgi:hypothetical protein